MWLKVAVPALVEASCALPQGSNGFRFETIGPKPSDPKPPHLSLSIFLSLSLSLSISLSISLSLYLSLSLSFSLSLSPKKETKRI